MQLLLCHLDSLIGAGAKRTEPHQLRRNCGRMTLRRDISSGLDETNEAFGAIARSLSLQEIVRGAEYKADHGRLRWSCWH
jgi:hypothetical protein